MKINQIIVESDQLDELSPGDFARGIGTAVGKTAQGVGAVVGGAKGAWDAAKSGYQSGKSFVGGQRVGGTSPSGQGTGGTTAPAVPGRPPAPPSAGGSPRTFADMNDDELEDLKNFIDREITLRRSGNPAGGRGAGGPPSGGSTPPVGGGNPPSPTGGSPAPAGGSTPPSGGSPAPTGGAGNTPPSGSNRPSTNPPTGGTRQPTVDQIIQGPDGKPYKWLGAQWAEYHPARNSTGQIANRSIAAQLTQAVTSGSAQPYTPPAGGSPAPAPAARGNPTRQPTAPAGGTTQPASGSPAPDEQIQFGDLTPGQQAYKKAREKEGVEPDQIKAALDRGAGGGKKRPPLTSTAKRNTIGNNPEVTTDMEMSKVDPKSWDEGQQRRAELDARNAAAVARSASRRTAPATNEGFYSRFLGKSI